MLIDIIAGPPGLVAVGCLATSSGDCLRGLLLTSPDGKSWTQVDLDGATNASIQRVHRVGDRLFAVGFAIDDARMEVRAVAWTSVDGRSWSPIRSASFTNQALGEVIDSPAGTVAIGGNARYASEGGGFVVWDVEADGTFGEARNADATGHLEAVQSAVWTGKRYLAWGPCALCRSDGDVRPTSFMASPDGKAWSVLPEIEAFAGSTVMGIVAVGHGLVAVGYEGIAWPTSPRAWVSPDSATWQPAQVAPDGASMETVDMEGSELVARGEDTSGTDSSPVSWESPDGGAWTRLPNGGDMPALTGFKALRRATVDGRVCVAGSFYGDPRKPDPFAVIYCRE